MYALVNGRIIASETIFEDKAIIINHNLIMAIVDKAEIPQETQVVDVNGSFISAGFIDLQLNGCGGVLFNDDISLNTIKTMLQTNLKFGCTSFLPTLITTSQADIEKALQVTAETYKLMPNNVLGIHVEGPYISKQKKGIHNEQYIRSITDDEVDMFVKFAKELPIILTLAPEENSNQHIQQLLNAGIKVAVGHSNASYERASEVFAMGVNLATHLYNAMSPFSHREPGLVGAVLNHNVNSGIIVDGYHCDFASIKIAKKLKQENLYIVTDAASPVGTNMTSFIFGGQEVFVKDGKLVNKNSNLGGANIAMIESVKNASEKASFGIIEAIRSTTIYPAKIMQVNNKLGNIQQGYIANLAIFNSNYEMQYTVNNGEILPVKAVNP